MSFEITKPTETPSHWVADRRLWLTADESEAVEDGDPRARFLLCGAAGDTVPKAQAEALGLLKEPEPEVKMEAKPEDKAMAKSATKAVVKKTANKARKTAKRRKRT